MIVWVRELKKSLEGLVDLCVRMCNLVRYGPPSENEHSFPYIRGEDRKICECPIKLGTNSLDSWDEKKGWQHGNIEIVVAKLGELYDPMCGVPHDVYHLPVKLTDGTYGVINYDGNRIRGPRLLSSTEKINKAIQESEVMPIYERGLASGTDHIWIQLRGKEMLCRIRYNDKTDCEDDVISSSRTRKAELISALH